MQLFFSMRVFSLAGKYIFWMTGINSFSIFWLTGSFFKQQKIESQKPFSKIWIHNLFSFVSFCAPVFHRLLPAVQHNRICSIGGSQLAALRTAQYIPAQVCQRATDVPN